MQVRAWAGEGRERRYSAWSARVRATTKGGKRTVPVYSKAKDRLPYRGYQNPKRYFQVSSRSVRVKKQGSRHGYRTPSMISTRATRKECVDVFITCAMQYHCAHALPATCVP